MEKKEKDNKDNKNKNKLNLPLELFFDIINAANTSDMIVNDENNNKNSTKILILKEYFIKKYSFEELKNQYFSNISAMSDIPNESEDDKQKIKQLEEQVATLSRANETLTTVYQLELLEKDDKIAKLEAALAKKATGQGTSREANTASNVVVGGETAQQPNLSVVPYKNPNVPSGNSASFGFESLCENYISPKTPFPDYAMNYLIEGNNESSSNLQSFPTQQPQLPNQQQVMPYVHGGTSIVYEGTSRPISYLYNTAAQFYGISSPSIRPKPNFNAREVAEFLRGFITDNGCEKKYIMNVMETIISCNNSQRLEFLSVYQQMFNANLFDQLKLKGYFADIIKALMMDTIYLDAYELHRQKDSVRRHLLLFEILMKSSNEHFKRICNVYNQQYNGNLKEDMISGTYGFLNNLIGSLFNFSRDETMKTNVFQAKQFAIQLNTCKEHERFFNVLLDILSTKNMNQIRNIFGEFETICSGQSIDMCINVLFWDDTSLRDVLLNVIKIVTKTSIYFSQVLKDIISSSETRGANLTYYIVARSEIDICDIKIEYQKQHNNISLEQAIESGFCGKQYGLFKKGIIAIINGTTT